MSTPCTIIVFEKFCLKTRAWIFILYLLFDCTLIHSPKRLLLKRKKTIFYQFFEFQAKLKLHGLNFKTKFFDKNFANSFEVFADFSLFSYVSEKFRMCSDPFWSVPMHADAFECNWMLLGVFGSFRKFSFLLSDDFDIFKMFFDFGGLVLLTCYDWC